MRVTEEKLKELTDKASNAIQAMMNPVDFGFSGSTERFEKFMAACDPQTIFDLIADLKHKDEIIKTSAETISTYCAQKEKLREALQEVQVNMAIGTNDWLTVEDALSDSKEL